MLAQVTDSMYKKAKTISCFYAADVQKLLKTYSILDNNYAPVMKNEMSILQLPEKTLIPHQVQERRRKKALVEFFV